mgnify:CR=1 FL=1
MGADTFSFGVSYVMLFAGFYFKSAEQDFAKQGREALRVFLKDKKIGVSPILAEEDALQVVEEIKKGDDYQTEEFLELGKLKKSAKHNKQFCFAFSCVTHVLGFIS